MPIRALLTAVLLLAGLLAAAPAADAARHHHHRHHHHGHHHHHAHAAKRHKAHRHARRAHAHGQHVRALPARTPVAVQNARPTVVAPPAPAGCADTQLVPTAADLDRIRAAILCLHNLTRAQSGLGTLSENGALDAAALGHSSDMVTRRYFSHTTPDGGSFVDRILAAGYARPDDGWQVGENLAWGTGPLSTPGGLMQAWLNSPEHRANLLSRDYREIGIGVRLGTPSGGADGVTVSIDFGVRD